jgi:SAM-dependent methyltransferase
MPHRLADPGTRCPRGSETGIPEPTLTQNPTQGRGDRLGLYRALAGAGPLSPAELAERTATAERYVREWLSAQAAGGYVAYDPDSGRYTLPPEQAVALTDPDSPAYLPGFFQIALGSVLDSPKIEAARSGAGFGWHEHVHDVHEGCERFFRPGYNTNLTWGWLPALDGVVAKLERGALVADVGCGHRASTILMAQAFPNSTFAGSDYHDGSIETARQHAREAGVAGRVSFDTAPAAAYGGGGYDLVTMFDCLHDMGDPVAAARHVRGTLKPDGTWMIVEPYAGVPLARGWAGTRRAGRGGEDPRRRHRRRVHPVPPGRRDTVQPRVRSTPVTPARRPFPTAPGVSAAGEPGSARGRPPRGRRPGPGA